jgi:hypothetical protein
MGGRVWHDGADCHEDRHTQTDEGDKAAGGAGDRRQAAGMETGLYCWA